MTCAMCPSCGYNLDAERPLVAGRFSYAPGDGFAVDGVRLAVAPMTHEMLGSVMAARGRVVGRDALVGRLGSEAINACNRIAICKHAATRAMRALGVDLPIANVPKLGLRWIGPAVTTCS